MAHLLYRYGVAALMARREGAKVLPPMLSFTDAMRLREQFYADGQVWPYESVVPGAPQPPAGAQEYLARQVLKDEKRTKRQKEIMDALTKMPQLISEYKAARRLDWSEVTPLDRLTLTNKKIREKYVRQKLAKS